MSPPICLITGGNAGIGFAAAVQLARDGSDVVIATRNVERGEVAASAIRQASGNDAVSAIRMDLSSRRSILDGCEAFRRLGYRRLDALIHNAAEFDVGRKVPVYSEDGVETVWATNHVGPVLLTCRLERELLQSPRGRVVTVSSKGLVLYPHLRVRLHDPEFRRGRFRVSRAYYQSKLAQVMYTFWLAERFRRTTATANCVRVPNVRIDINRYPNLSELQRRLYGVKRRFSISPEAMARVYAWLALSPDLTGVTGRYVDERRRPVRAGRCAEDETNVRALMRLTARYVPELLDQREDDPP